VACLQVWVGAGLGVGGCWPRFGWVLA